MKKKKYNMNEDNKARNVTVTLDKAREWYNSGNESLKEIALQVFNKDELVYNFKNITTFKDACKALNLDYMSCLINADKIYRISRASAAMFKLNVIRKALNLGQGLYLTRGSFVWYPQNQFITENCPHYRGKIKLRKLDIVGKIKNEGVIYSVLGGSASSSIFKGIGVFDSRNEIGCAASHAGFLGCASKEIAQHFSRCFGMLITEAKYGDMVDFEITYTDYL